MSKIYYDEGDELPTDRRPLVDIGLSRSRHRVTTRARDHYGRDLPAIPVGAATTPFPTYVEDDPDDAGV